ncbi:hypothetical protein [Streptosporangium longisporum]|uniref:Uncharacterized protein n=1 Tax=Streptosporangium longisporum TaxID=46187 RepID=A0ABP6L3J5_9ACTN
MGAVIFLSCEEHPEFRGCDDDESFTVETVTAARALWAAKHPGREDTKISQVVISCRVDGCMTRLYLKHVESVTEARALLSSHRYGWYRARRAGGRLVDGCQTHLGACCVHHAFRSWEERLPFPQLDPGVILPGEPGFPGEPVAQLDLFATGVP